MPSRRTFLLRSTALVLALSTGARPAWARGRPRRIQPSHPTPRPGITAAKLPTHDELAGAERAQVVFDAVREIPEIVDGYLIMPDRPGWGTEPNEEALAAYPPKGVGGLLNHGQKA